MLGPGWALAVNELDGEVRLLWPLGFPGLEVGGGQSARGRGRDPTYQLLEEGQGSDACWADGRSRPQLVGCDTGAAWRSQHKRPSDVEEGQEVRQPGCEVGRLVSQAQGQGSDR